MKRIIPIVLAILLFASPAYSFTSPPELLDKLDEMFAWTRSQMDRPDMPRPPIFISSQAKFEALCEPYSNEDDEYGCDEIDGMYLIGEWEIHVVDIGAQILMDKTLIHEMVHAVQHVKYGHAFMVEKHHKEFIQKESRLLASRYIAEMYGIVTRP